GGGTTGCTPGKGGRRTAMREPGDRPRRVSYPTRSLEKDPMIRRAIMPGMSLAAGAVLLLAGCAGAPEKESATAESGDRFPVELVNCDHEVVVESAPERVVTLNQGATAVVLALGLGDRLAGTAYLDDAISDRWAQEYEKVPVLAEEYPTNEALLKAEPDLVY